MVDVVGSAVSGVGCEGVLGGGDVVDRALVGEERVEKFGDDGRREMALVLAGWVRSWLCKASGSFGDGKVEEVAEGSGLTEARLKTRGLVLTSFVTGCHESSQVCEWLVAAEKEKRKKF